MDLCGEAKYFRNNQRRRIVRRNETPEKASIHRINQTEPNRLRRAVHSISDISFLMKHHCGEMAEVSRFPAMTKKRLFATKMNHKRLW